MTLHERDALTEVVAAQKVELDGLHARMTTAARRNSRLDHDLWEAAAELERVTAERDAARDLGIRLYGRLGEVEALHEPLTGDGLHWVPQGVCLECGIEHPCPTYRLAHGTDQ